MIVKVIRKIDGKDKWCFRADIALRRQLEHRVESIPAFIDFIIRSTCRSVGKEPIDLSDFVVKICREKDPKAAWSYKRHGVTFENFPKQVGGLIPDMIISYADDFNEFVKNVIHETLHCIAWDEKAVESKTQEAFKCLNLSEINSNTSSKR